MHRIFHYTRALPELDSSRKSSRNHYNIPISTAMAKSKVSRKSVSFQQLMDDTKDEASGDLSIPSTPSKSKPPLPSMNSKILATPIHSLFTIIGLFKLGLMENTTGVLLKSIPMVILFLMVFGYILTQNVVPSTKKKANGIVSTKKKQSENTLLLLAGSAVVCLVMSVPIFVMVILFGAPLSNHITETYLLSIHLTFLVFYPLLVYFKMDTAKFSSLFDYDHIYRAIFTNQILSSSFFTIIGTWFGVFPIPLDWDRPWQQWPITLLTGAYVGSFLGGILSIVVTAVLEDN